MVQRLKPKRLQHSGILYKNEKGIALITALLFLMVLTVLGTTAVMISSTDIKIGGNYKTTKQTFYVAEAGLELMRSYLKYDGNVDTNHSWADPNFYFPSPTGTITVTNGAGYYSIGLPESLRTVNIGSSSGTFSIRLKNVGTPFNPNRIFVESTGTMAGTTAVLEGYLALKDYGPWNNAIFAGAGASGATINGNADIRGSVHILGTGLTSADYAVYMSGGALIGNNYNGMDAALKALIPSISSPESLDAELRVKHGKAGLSGAATVGQPESTSSNKDTVSGAYVTDGFGGTAGTSSVCSDNGTGHDYDLGDDISFPSLNDPYTDPTTGTNYGTYAAFLTANAYVCSGNLNISSDTPSFSIGNAQGSITWDQTGTLTITGLTKVVGNIDIAKKSAPITYNGKGTLYSTGDINIHGNLLPTSSFPTTNAIGLIATQDIEIATGSGESQLKAAGAFYAENSIISAKQNEILGTFVSNYFDMGSQVPKIYQVPALATNLPPGMPGSQGYYVVKVISWREVR
jgi:hypothetical protein